MPLVFTVAWRRGPSAEPIVGEFDRKAAKQDISVQQAHLEAPEPAGEVAPSAVAAPAPVVEETPSDELITISDDRVPITPEELGVTRRKFLNRAAYGLFVGGFFSVFGLAVLDFMWPKLKGGFGTKVNLGLLTDLRNQVAPGDGGIYPINIPEAQSWIVPIDAKDIPGSSFEGLPVIVGADGSDPGLMAMWQKCVHLGCRVPDCPSSKGFECPCHGSRYNYHGEYEAGPAPRNLDRFVVSVDDAGNMIADTGAVIKTPRAKHKTIAYPQGPSCL